MTSTNAPKYLPDDWQRLTWHKPNNGRHYQVELKQNLFGNWILVRQWGSSKKRGGRRLEIICDDYQHACQQLQIIQKQRQRRGYLESD